MAEALSDETLLEQGLLDAPVLGRGLSGETLSGEKTPSNEASCRPSRAVDEDVFGGRFSSSKSENNYHLNPFLFGHLAGIVPSF
ncbi:hypothetical protein MRS44_014042 [Fusarium solani]|uniref:Uncharacterized protein n=1 Tax=Fusarium ambrosium TaxID=131363 RepID=A0A428RNH8_9HYPO|nr:hypothetical protein MRS44_014042 [Fusarium solani]RSL79105.1 hypothetical protein CDV31_017232 [Fusarium ambrosium]